MTYLGENYISSERLEYKDSHKKRKRERIYEGIRLGVFGLSLISGVCLIRFMWLTSEGWVL